MLEQSDVKDDNAQNINHKIKRAAAAQRSANATL